MATNKQITGNINRKWFRPNSSYGAPKFQDCMHSMRGQRSTTTSGLIHVDAANHNRQSLKNLLSIMYSKEDERQLCR